MASGLQCSRKARLEMWLIQRCDMAEVGTVYETSSRRAVLRAQPFITSLAQSYPGAAGVGYYSATHKHTVSLCRKHLSLS